MNSPLYHSCFPHCFPQCFCLPVAAGPGFTHSPGVEGSSLTTPGSSFLPTAALYTDSANFFSRFFTNDVTCHQSGGSIKEV